MMYKYQRTSLNKIAQNFRSTLPKSEPLLVGVPGAAAAAEYSFLKATLKRKQQAVCSTQALRQNHIFLTLTLRVH